MTHQYRTTSGGQIDRAASISFTFDGKLYRGYKGDTLASALLANGVHLTGRSFKYHRPRGIQTAGSEEPNAIVELRSGPRKEPNTRATTIELFDGLVARSQNRWPSLAFDFMSVNNLFSPLLSAGFYYKTFMWPVSFWTNVYEHVIRRAAGLGTAPTAADPDFYEQCHEHCDVLVVGAGPAGLSAALAAAATDARVILVDEHPLPGGSLNHENFTIEGKPGSEWAADAVTQLEAMDNVHIFNRTTVFGYYDHNVVAAVEKVNDHLPVPPKGHARQRMWTFYPTRVVIAAGATERPLVFGNNDKPGIMLASAVRTYVNCYGVKPGRRAVVATNNNDAYRTAIDCTSCRGHGRRGGRFARASECTIGRRTRKSFDSADHRRYRRCRRRWSTRQVRPDRHHPGRYPGPGAHQMRSDRLLRRLEPQRTPAQSVGRQTGLRCFDHQLCTRRITPGRGICWCRKRQFQTAGLSRPGCRGRHRGSQTGRL